jgi:hypothetical protein
LCNRHQSWFILMLAASKSGLVCMIHLRRGWHWLAYSSNNNQPCPRCRNAKIQPSAAVGINWRFEEMFLQYWTGFCGFFFAFRFVCCIEMGVYEAISLAMMSHSL